MSERVLILDPEEFEALVELVDVEFGTTAAEAPFARGRLIRKVRDLQ